MGTYGIGNGREGCHMDIALLHLFSLFIQGAIGGRREIVGRACCRRHFRSNRYRSKRGGEIVYISISTIFVIACLQGMREAGRRGSSHGLFYTREQAQISQSVVRANKMATEDIGVDFYDEAWKLTVWNGIIQRRWRHIHKLQHVTRMILPFSRIWQQCASNADSMAGLFISARKPLQFP